MEGGFSTQVILAKAQAIVEGGYSPDVGIVIDLLQPKESVQASMIPVVLQEQAGLYMYRFQVPIGGIYRFRLSTRLSPSKEPSVLGTRLIDYAISRAAAEDGICANHFQPLPNGNELHLGEADYLALLAHGQCACTTTTSTTSIDHKVDCCYKCPFDETRGRELGDAPANTGLGAEVALDRYGKTIPCEDLAWSEHFEQRGGASGELPQKTQDEQVASFPEPDEPAATDPDAFLAVDDNSGGMEGRSVEEDKDDFHEEAKWNGVCASGEEGDCLQRRLHQQETSVPLKPGDKEMEEEELEKDLLLTQRSLATAYNAWSNDPTEFNDTRLRLGSSGVGTGSVLASARDQPWAPGVHPDSVLASARDEPWNSADEAKDGTRETYVFERCQRNCVEASDKENILFAVFDDHHTFLLPQLNDSFRSSLCSANLPLPSDVVRDLLEVISGSKFFRLLDESDSERIHPIVGSDFEPLLLSTFENIDLSEDVETVMKPHESKDTKQSSRGSMLQTLPSEDSEAVSRSTSSSATRVTAIDPDVDVIIEILEDGETGVYGTAESYQVDFQLRLRFWRRARLAVIRVLQRIRDFFRGLLRGRGRAPQSSSKRRSRRSRPSWTSDAERVECDDLSKV